MPGGDVQVAAHVGGVHPLRRLEIVEVVQIALRPRLEDDLPALRRCHGATEAQLVQNVLFRPATAGVLHQDPHINLPQVPEPLRELRPAELDPFELRRGDVVVFRCPCGSGSPLVKRVVGLPGDRVAIDGDRVIVNDRVFGKASGNGECSSSESVASTLVGSHQYFVLGDCRRASLDSRSFGAVPAKGILGRAVLSLWPPGSVGRVQ